MPPRFAGPPAESASISKHDSACRNVSFDAILLSFDAEDFSFVMEVNIYA